jgi:hypothetical protein
MGHFFESTEPEPWYECGPDGGKLISQSPDLIITPAKPIASIVANDRGIILRYNPRLDFV